MEKLCKNCVHWLPYIEDRAPINIKVGTCAREPFDVRDMGKNDCTVNCGHDGGIITGSDFSCPHYILKKNLINKLL